MKVWISKYALTGGIIECECDPPRDGEAHVYPGSPWASYVGFALGREALTTREAAVAIANEMRARKIASLKKQLAKLEAMTFEETTE